MVVNLLYILLLTFLCYGDGDHPKAVEIDEVKGFG